MCPLNWMAGSAIGRRFRSPQARYGMRRKFHFVRFAREASPTAAIPGRGHFYAVHGQNCSDRGVLENFDRAVPAPENWRVGDRGFLFSARNNKLIRCWRNANLGRPNDWLKRFLNLAYGAQVSAREPDSRNRTAVFRACLSQLWAPKRSQVRSGSASQCPTDPWPEDVLGPDFISFPSCRSWPPGDTLSPPARLHTRSSPSCLGSGASGTCS